MTPENASTAGNVAGDHASVGVQAHIVHGDIIYELPPGASPEKKLEIGIRFLDNGIPGRARELIGEAVVADRVHTSRAGFHWLLAQLSGRTIQQLSPSDITELCTVPKRFQLRDNDAWTDGIKMVRRLLESAETVDEDLRDVLFKDLDKLDAEQRNKILQHVEVFLNGPLVDQMWARIREKALRQRMVPAREKRVWKFFQPAPTRHWTRPVRPADVTGADRVKVVVATAFLTIAVAYLGLLLLRRGDLLPIVAYLLSIAGGCVSAPNAREWRYRVERLRSKELEYWRPRRSGSRAQRPGFVKDVDRLFVRYFARYVPDGMDPVVWLAQTEGIRQSIRDEIVEVYRESGTGARNIAWLIRYRVSDVKRRWQAGTLVDYRAQLRTPLATRAKAIGGLAALTIGGVWAIGAAVSVSWFTTAVAAIVALASGWLAAVTWLHIVVERKRFAADQAEDEQLKADCAAAYERWIRKLADKPSDSEMATWLDCDRKVLMDEALRHYKLTPSSVIAHAFIEAPVRGCERARVKEGPMRYSDYRLLVFLLTKDGVRQVTADLEFKSGAFSGRQRMNYRFDAVASVRVVGADTDRRKLELTLVNGDPISLPLIEPSTPQSMDDGDSESFFGVTLDAAGLSNTLHVLEGIAAEGKGWIVHERLRGKDRIAALKAAVEDLLE